MRTLLQAQYLDCEEEVGGPHSVPATFEKKLPQWKAGTQTSSELLSHYKKKEKKDST